MNNVSIVGNITNEIKLKRSKAGKEYSKVIIAINDPRGRPAYVPVVLWSSAARYAEEYLKIGDTISVVGKIRTIDYINESGKQCTSIDVSCTRLDKLKSLDREREREYTTPQTLEKL